ncbi:Uncharacterized protein PRO82_001166 [Candidatus Protochlamydia amoebophila]|uniref:hypothetical protein n=1 Tax=Candidatus Protochlamydia amoebophila TaxID=362787 RepID=UPI001BCA16B8|nr:hypothetical protein [Candidatus Protochlamydia amoebophila]MBS4163860.1 Uncharacterized protein [Candidatus Protochlamydia amoebophila]
MRILSNHFSCYSSSFFKGHFLYLTKRQKTIMAIAIGIFSCFIAGYLLYQVINKRKIKPLSIDAASLNREPNFESSLSQPVEEQRGNLPIIGPALIHRINSLISAFPPMGNESDEQTIEEEVDYTGVPVDTTLLSQYWNIAYKNASSLEEADIILMGEDHKILAYQQLEIAIINQFGKDDDVLLLEGVEYQEEAQNFSSICPKRSYDLISKNIRLFGFEENLLTLVESLNMLKELERKAIILKTNIELKKRSELPLDVTFSEKEMHEGVCLLEKLFLLTDKRNEFLITSINRLLERYPGSKLFVIAGSHHIVSPVFNLIDHLPPNLKYAILTYKV